MDIKDNKERDKDVKKRPRPKAERVTFGEYLRGVKTEIKKVVWPTKKELGSFTVVVIIACTFFSLLFAGIDYAVLQALRVLLRIDI
ncbi:MAG: preprotein translocase subunit SecE [Clostridiales bacterium]|nr:preprotein translocase subunit SecE [Clostridiales bacterium]